MFGFSFNFGNSRRRIVTPTASLSISWDAVVSVPAVDGYRVEKSLDGSAWLTAATVAAGALSATLTGLLVSTLYYLRVVAFNAIGDGAPSNPIKAFTNWTGPTGLVATAISDTRIDLTWTLATTTPVTGYRILRRASGVGSYASVATVANNATSYSNTGLTASTAYDYKVVGYNDNTPEADTNSPDSNVETESTMVEQVAPTISTVASNVAGAELTLTASEICSIGAGGNGGFAIAGKTVAYVSGFTGTNTAVYSVTPALAFGDVVTLAYTQPGNGVEDAVGNDLATFAGKAVTNNVPTSGTSPGTGSLLAWYDFDDAGGLGTRNQANVGTYTLSAQNAPTYGTAGGATYGISTNGTPGAYWQSTTLDDNFGNVAGDWSFAFRFQAKSGISSGDMVFLGNGARFQLEWNTTASGIRGRAGRLASVDSSVVPAEDTWYTAVLVWDNTAALSKISINGGAFVTLAGAGTFANGTHHFGATSTSNSNPVWIDWGCFYAKALTADNSLWLYNAGATRVFANL